MTPPRFAWFAAGLVAGIALTLAATRAPVVVSAAAGNTSRIVLENERVRVKEAIFQPDTPPRSMGSSSFGLSETMSLGCGPHMTFCISRQSSTLRAIGPG